MPTQSRKKIVADILEELQETHESNDVPNSFARDAFRKTSPIAIRVDTRLAEELKETCDLANSMFPADLLSYEVFAETILRVGLKDYLHRLQFAYARVLMNAEELLDLTAIQDAETEEPKENKSLG